MSGSLIAGTQTVTITLAGREFALRRAKVSIFQEAEAEIIRRRPDPIEQIAGIAAKLPQDQAKMVWEIALDRATNPKPVSTQELMAWITSVEGMVWFVWTMIGGAMPIEEVRRAIADMDVPELDALGAKVQIATGMDDLKNSSGRPDPQTAAPAPAPNNPQSTGKTSTEPLPSGTAGDQST